MLTPPSSEIHRIHGGVVTALEGPCLRAYAHLSELLAEYIVPMTATVHPPLKYVVWSTRRIATPSYVLADCVVRVAVKSVTEPLQPLLDCFAIEGIVRGVILVEHLLGVGACRLSQRRMNTKGLQPSILACLVVKLQHTLLIVIQLDSATVAGRYDGESGFRLPRFQYGGTDGDDRQKPRRQ